jgi:hypothetical protein
MATNNLEIALLVLSQPERYVEGSLMREWALKVVDGEKPNL